MTVELNGERSITIRAGNKYAENLTRDEALWVLACFLIEQRWPYLKTREEWVEYDAALGISREERNAT